MVATTDRRRAGFWPTQRDRTIPAKSRAHQTTPQRRTAVTGTEGAPRAQPKSKTRCVARLRSRLPGAPRLQTVSDRRCKKLVRLITIGQKVLTVDFDCRALAEQGGGQSGAWRAGETCRGGESRRVVIRSNACVRNEVQRNSKWPRQPRNFIVGPRHVCRSIALALEAAFLSYGHSGLSLACNLGC